MRASTADRFIFIANPKTGTSSLQAALDPYCDIRSRKSEGVGDHWPAARLRPWFAERGHDWGDFFSFMAIRDPWRRAASLFIYAQRQPRSIYYDAACGAGGLLAFLKSPVASAPKRIRHLDHMTRDENGAGLVSHVFRIEDLGTEWPRLETRLGRRLPLGRLNASPDYDYRALYCEEAVELIRTRYRSDIDFGRYTF